MPRMTQQLFLIAVTLLACSGAPEPAPAAAPAAAPTTEAAPATAPAAPPKSSFAPAIEADLARIAAESGGTLGVAVLHIETCEIAALRGDERFPMQSVFKFPVGAQILKREAEGKLRLDQKVTVRREDLRWAHSLIAERHCRGQDRG